LPGARRAVSVDLGVNLLKGVPMKARLAVLVVALALAIAGAFHVSPSRADVPPPAPAATLVLDPANAPDAETLLEPGGWWDWH
jgi:hypothetical protein